MSKFSILFNKVPVEIQNRSGFDMSHENLIGGLMPGTLYPVLTEEIMPNDRFSLKAIHNLQLPPMATDFLVV